MQQQAQFYAVVLALPNCSITYNDIIAHMHLGETCVLLVYKFWKVSQLNISTCKTFWTPLVHEACCYFCSHMFDSLMSKKNCNTSLCKHLQQKKLCIGFNVKTHKSKQQQGRWFFVGSKADSIWQKVMFQIFRSREMRCLGKKHIKTNAVLTEWDY